MDEVSVHERISKQKKQIVDLWESTGMLKGIANDLEREQVALILDNQRVWNSDVNEQEMPNEFLKEYYPYLKRVSIPIARRVYDPVSFVGFSLVSVQAMMGAEHSFLYRDLYGNLRARTVRAKSAKIGHIPGRPDPEKYQVMLDGECDICTDYSANVVRRMNVEVVNDIHRNAPTVTQHGWRNRDDLEAHIRMVMGRIEKQSGRKPTWILTTPELAAELLEQEHVVDENPMYKGSLKREKVFSFPGLSEGTIILGHKGDLYTSGYFYCPFIPLFLPPSREPDPGELVDYGIFARYGKAMPFPEFYGRIQVHGYSIDKENEENG